MLGVASTHHCPAQSQGQSDGTTDQQKGHGARHPRERPEPHDDPQLQRGLYFRLVGCRLRLGRRRSHLAARRNYCSGCLLRSLLRVHRLVCASCCRPVSTSLRVLVLSRFAGLPPGVAVLLIGFFRCRVVLPLVLILPRRRIAIAAVRPGSVALGLPPRLGLASVVLGGAARRCAPCQGSAFPEARGVLRGGRGRSRGRACCLLVCRCAGVRGLLCAGTCVRFLYCWGRGACYCSGFSIGLFR
mmetsp:Transcript_76871/g.176390  ORF Transcript_76871/g.176390 Transcript_76871/m.176390 type:complete len:243 (-) Transcript_76871:195-923(-)